MKLLQNKKEFLILVLANLIVQLGITYYVMENAHKDADGKQAKTPHLYYLLFYFL